METQEQCRMLSAKALTYQVDVTNEIDVETTFEAIIQDFGQLNGLVNNAGVLRDGLLVKAKDGVISKMSLDQFNLVMNVNVTGTFLCGREAAVKMIESGSQGVIINISSVARAGNIGQTNYSASKAAVATMATTWARELARYGIRAAAVAEKYTGNGNGKGVVVVRGHFETIYFPSKYSHDTYSYGYSLPKSVFVSSRWHC